ncbi:GGDEF domain-containing protein [uncultured Aquitalea sp.]|uniref:GGDEF domain-containing protein n=1 Tax=uncultured Aquitalea sp. TaxID=540272 RepID=UPI0025F8E3E6|nr:GGDEF domain-containing protein [uncultured Aquitalea sp.]
MPSAPLPVLVPVFMVTEVLNCAMLMVLASLWRTRLPGCREWMASMAAVIVYLPLLGLRGIIPDSLSIVLGNTMLALSAASHYAGCARFLRQSVPVRALTLGVLWVALGVSACHYLVESLAGRVATVSVFLVLLFSVESRLLLRHRIREHKPAVYWASALCAALLAALHLARGLYFATGQAEADQLLAPSLANVVLLSLSAAMMPGLAMLAVLLLHESMLADMRYQAHHDGMTGSLTRRQLESQVAALIREAERQAAPLSLLVIDFDHFKRINDNHGHAAGDQVLQAFMRIARAHMRQQDLIGRMGGEEFAILLPGASADAARQVAERLRRAAEAQAVTVADKLLPYTLSIGVATLLPQEGFAELYRRADRALYQAKHSGRNRVCPALDAEALPVGA